MNPQHFNSWENPEKSVVFVDLLLFLFFLALS